MMRQVTFPFNRRKLAEVLAFFASSGVSDLTKLKAAKLIYYVDKHHLRAHGRPVVGGAYYCMPFGPVPGKALQAMNDVIEATGLDGFQPITLGDGEPRVMVSFGQDHPRFSSVDGGFDASVFSRSELESLKFVLATYGPETAGRLVDLTHQDPTWTKPNEARMPGGRVPIPYQLFFEDASEEERRMWKLIEAEHSALFEDDGYAPFPSCEDSVSPAV